MIYSSTGPDNTSIQLVQSCCNGHGWVFGSMESSAGELYILFVTDISVSGTGRTESQQQQL